MKKILIIIIALVAASGVWAVGPDISDQEDVSYPSAPLGNIIYLADIENLTPKKALIKLHNGPLEKRLGEIDPNQKKSFKKLSLPLFEKQKTFSELKHQSQAYQCAIDVYDANDPSKIMVSLLAIRSETPLPDNLGIHIVTLFVLEYLPFGQGSRIIDQRHSITDEQEIDEYAVDLLLYGENFEKSKIRVTKTVYEHANQ